MHTVKFALRWMYLTGAFLLFLCSGKIHAQQNSCCTLPGWDWERLIQIDNTNNPNALNNFQVMFIIDTQTPISQGKMKPDGSDMRFTDINCGNTLDYWIEGIINTPNTKVWVTIPNIPASGTTSIYMYYGNNAAPAMSNFNAVFPNVLTINNNVTLTGNQNYDWIDVQAGGNVSLAAGQPLTLNARKVIISGTINGDNMGYGPAAGPGAGGDGGGGVGGGGGGYGGNGGSGGSGNGGPAYGTPNGPDIDMGSGGGGSDCAPTGPGGGMVSVYAGWIDVFGTIRMRGGNAANCCCGNTSEAAAGGAGGGILLAGDYVNGGGTLDVQGGRGGDSDDKEGGGGGAGGRIKIFITQANTFGGTTNVNGGPPGIGDQSGMQPGQNGTFTENQAPGLNYTIGPEDPTMITPNADFTVSDICMDDTAQFNDASTISSGSIVGWAWAFGDGSSSTQQNPTHPYNVADTFNVMLTVTSDSGCVDSITKPIIVEPLPQADFNFVSECAGQGTQFSDTSTIASGSITSWEWDFGDGSPPANGPNQAHTYTNDSTYSVTLTVTSAASCSSSVSQQVPVYSNPVGDFSVTDACEGFPNSFSDQSTGSISDWQWDFGDGGIDSVQNPTYTYSGGANTYNVTLIVTTGNNCRDTVSGTAEVHPNPTADFTGTDVCESFPTDFTDMSSVPSGSIDGWLWDFGDVSGTDTTQNPSYVYNSPDTFTVTLVAATDQNCMDTATNDVVVFPGVTADFTATEVCHGVTTDFTDQSTISAGNITSWDWDFDDFNGDTVPNPTHQYAQPGDYEVVLTVESSNGCNSADTQLVQVHPLPVADFTSTAVCLNETTDFTDTSTITDGNVVAWSWNFDDNSPTNTNQNPSHDYSSSGLYDVVLVATSDEGCSDTIIDLVEVYPLPQVDFAADPAEGCMPLTVDFEDLSTIDTGSNVMWEWTFDNLGTSTQQNPTFVFQDSGVYDIGLEVTSDKGCVSDLTNNNMVTVHEKPIPAFDFEPDITEILYPEIEFFDLTPTSTDWLWHFGDGDSATVQNPVHAYSDTGKYTVTFIPYNQYGCSDTVYDIVIIQPSFTIYVPSAFTPNDDGINDEWKPDGIGHRDYELRIFNRWGEQLFFTTDPDQGWDGRLQGRRNYAEPGVYVYRVFVRDNENRIQDFHGHFTLIR